MALEIPPPKKSPKTCFGKTHVADVQAQTTQQLVTGYALTLALPHGARDSLGPSLLSFPVTERCFYVALPCSVFPDVAQQVGRNTCSEMKRVESRCEDPLAELEPKRKGLQTGGTDGA